MPLKYFRNQTFIKRSAESQWFFCTHCVLELLDILYILYRSVSSSSAVISAINWVEIFVPLDILANLTFTQKKGEWKKGRRRSRKGTQEEEQRELNSDTFSEKVLTFSRLNRSLFHCCVSEQLLLNTRLSAKTAEKRREKEKKGINYSKHWCS